MKGNSKESSFDSKDKLELLKKLQKIATVDRQKEGVAIVGIGCRYPGDVNDLKSFSDLLYNGVDAVSEIPSSRWDVEKFFQEGEQSKGKMNTRKGGFLDQIDGFDADFFGISPREALSMDPQQRLLLEVTQEAIDNTGLIVKSLKGTDTGVYIGITTSEYSNRTMLESERIDPYSGTGSYLNVAAGRISYSYGFQGPCMAVDAACASSLVSVHLACEALKNEECTMALAGGVSLMLAPETTVYLAQTGALAPDGRCKTFDAAADGYGRAEGCAVLVLKRLQDAIADNDVIHAVIKGTAVNQDGASSGLTVPNGRAQQHVIRQALKRANIKPSEVGYIEAHGTGTPLGDPIEVRAIKAVYRKDRSHDNPLYIGSLKTNFGHAEAAAGIGGLIKTVVAIKSGKIPPHLHFKQLSEKIDLSGIHCQIPVDTIEWVTPSDSLRIAGVSSFGLSGTIAHAIVSQAPKSECNSVDVTMNLLPLTAKSEEAVNALATKFLENIEHWKTCSLSDLTYSACMRSQHYNQRSFIVYKNTQELEQRLTDLVERRESVGVLACRPSQVSSKIAFVFSGQGSQWLGMGQQLMQTESVFNEQIQIIDEVFKQYIDWSLVETLTLSQLTVLHGRDDVIQPTIFAIQVALAHLWEYWGVVPYAVIGHSMGEIAAAYVAGILTIHDASKIICTRSKLVGSTSHQGAMALVELNEKDALAAIAGYREKLSISAYNSPDSVLLSGDAASLDSVLEVLERDQVFCRKVKVDYASHCYQMDVLLPVIRDQLSDISPSKAKAVFFSTVTGTQLHGEELTANYWADNLRKPVLFYQQTKMLINDGIDVFIEMSPNPVLTVAIESTLTAMSEREELNRKITVLGSLKKNEDEQLSIKTSMGALFCLGVAINFEKVLHISEKTGRGKLLELPAYPWQRKSYWIEHKETMLSGLMSNGSATKNCSVHPLLGEYFKPAKCKDGIDTYFWQFTIGLSNLPFLGGHIVRDMLVVPATAYLDLALTGAIQALGNRSYCMKSVEFSDALIVNADIPITMQLAITSEDDHYRFSIDSFYDDNSDEVWIRHMTGDIYLFAGRDDVLDNRELLFPTSYSITASQHYATMDDSGIVYGAAFQGLEAIDINGDRSVAQLKSAQSLNLDLGLHTFHPALWDSAHQLLAAISINGQQRAGVNSNCTYIPRKAGEVVFHRAALPDEKLAVYARLENSSELKSPGDSSEYLCGSVFVLDANKKPLIEVRELSLLKRDVDRLDDINEWFYKLAAISLERGPSVSVLKQQTWIVITDQHYESDGSIEVINAIQKQGCDCIHAFNAEQWQEIDDQLYALDVSCAVELSRFFEIVWKRVAGNSKTFGGVLNLLPATAQERVHGNATDELIERLYLQVLEQARCLSELDTSKKQLNYCIVTRSSGKNSIQPIAYQAPLFGLARVINNELCGVRCSCVQLGSALGDSDDETQSLLRQLETKDNENEVILKERHRFGLRLQRITVLQNKAECNFQGTWLITGGLGGIGLVCAQWLADRGVKHLVLVSRQALLDETAQQMINDLSERDVSVVVRAVDISCEQQMCELFMQFGQSLPALKGVLHCAGVLDDALLVNQGKQQLQTVMQSKVTGTRLLDQFSRMHNPEVFMLFSAAATLLGSQGQANYAAVNAYMDAVAEQRQREGLSALSISWGVWNQIGMAASQDNRGKRLQEQGLVGIEPVNGIHVLDRLLNINVSHIVVLPIRLRTWVKQNVQQATASLFKSLLFFSNSDCVDNENSFLEKLEKLTIADERKQAVMEFISEQLAAVLRRDVSEMDPNKTLKDMGMDSLVALEFRNRMERNLKIKLSPTMVFNHPNIIKLAQFIVSKLSLVSGAESQQSTPHTRVTDELVLLSETDNTALMNVLSEIKDVDLDALSELTDSSLQK